MQAIHGNGHIYTDEIPVTDDEYDKASNGEITAFIRLGSQGLTKSNMVMVKDENNHKNIHVTNNYVTQFQGLQESDAQTQGLSSLGELKNSLSDSNGGSVGDSQPITVIFFEGV